MATRDKRIEKIRAWMKSITVDGGINRFDDLHIDEIDLVWRQRRRWLSGGIEAYRLALEIRAALGLDEGVAIGFGLGAYARRRTGFTAVPGLDPSVPPSVLSGPGTVALAGRSSRPAGADRPRLLRPENIECRRCDSSAR